MSTYVVTIEGQNIPLPPEIGESDETVKRALAPYYPEVANAMITRTEKDGLVTITVVKRAGTKGLYANGLAALEVCEEHRNPAIELAEQIEKEADQMDALGLLELDTQIEQAIQFGEEQARWVVSAVERLEKAAAQPAQLIVMGF